MSNNQMVRVPREPTREMLAAAREVNGIFPAWRAMVDAAPAEQNQGEPVALPARKLWNGLLPTADNLKGEGYNACIDELAKLGPLYTRPAQGEPVSWVADVVMHNGEKIIDGNMAFMATAEIGTKLYTLADPAEVERLRTENSDIRLQAGGMQMELDELRTQLAERDALLRECQLALDKAGYGTWQIDELLSAGAKPACQDCNGKLRLQEPGCPEGDCTRCASAEPSAPVMQIPEGYCVMPRRLTAENGAKALLLGEFKLEVTQECPECRELDEPVEGCEICDGGGEYGQCHMIPWDKIKFIYSEAVKGLAIQPSNAQ